MVFKYIDKEVIGSFTKGSKYLGLELTMSRTSDMCFISVFVHDVPFSGAKCFQCYGFVSRRVPAGWGTTWDPRSPVA